jgi:hypothetical protein
MMKPLPAFLSRVGRGFIIKEEVNFVSWITSS